MGTRAASGRRWAGFLVVRMVDNGGEEVGSSTSTFLLAIAGDCHCLHWLSQILGHICSLLQEQARFLSRFRSSIINN
jgi:hypothetical protein